MVTGGPSAIRLNGQHFPVALSLAMIGTLLTIDDEPQLRNEDTHEPFPSTLCILSCYCSTCTEAKLPKDIGRLALALHFSLDVLNAPGEFDLKACLQPR